MPFESQKKWYENLKVRHAVSVAIIIALLGTLFACNPISSEATVGSPAPITTDIPELSLAGIVQYDNILDAINNPLSVELVDCIDVPNHTQRVHEPKEIIPDISTEEVQKRFDETVEQIEQDEVDPQLETRAASSAILYQTTPDGSYSYSTVTEVEPGIYIGTEHVYWSYEPVTDAIKNAPNSVTASLGYFDVNKGEIVMEEGEIEITNCKTMIGTYLFQDQIQIAPIASVIVTSSDTPSITPHPGAVGGPCNISSPMHGLGFNSETLPSVVEYKDMSWADFSWRWADGAQIASLTYPVSTTSGSSGGGVVDSEGSLCGVGQYHFVNTSADGIDISYETGITPLPSVAVMDMIIKSVTKP